MPTIMPTSQVRAQASEPWFSLRPRLALSVIGMLFIAVLTLRLFAGDPVDAYSMLYVLPVALAATAFGVRGGVFAGLVALALILIWILVRDVTLSPTGWATRMVPILLLGVLLGRAIDRQRRAERDRREFEAAALLHAEAIEINDSLVQRMSAAKWALEAGQTDAGLAILTTAVSEAHRLVSGLLRRADMGRRSELLPVLAIRNAAEESGLEAH